MKSTFRIVVGVLFCALLVPDNPQALQTQVASSEVVCQPDQHFKGVSDSVAIQNCHSLVVFLASGSTLTVLLESRVYNMDATVNIVGVQWAKVVLRGASCDRKPTLLAVPHLGNQRILYGQGYNYTIRCLTIDGNKLLRDYNTPIPGIEDGKPTSHYLCGADGWRPALVILTGTDGTIEESEIRNGPCGTGVGMLGVRIIVRKNRFAHNGFEAPKLIMSATGVSSEELRWPGYTHQLSDAVTSVLCWACQIVDNIMEDTTDLAIVVGGGPDNIVRGNHCIVKTVYALGCFSVGRFSGGYPEWEGNHAGLYFENNTVSAVDGTVVYGLTVGSYFYCHSTNPECKYIVVHNAGTVRWNKIAGAKINLGVHGVEIGTIVENEIGEALSRAPSFFVPCQLNEPYITGLVKPGVVLQPGAKRMVIFGGECP